MKLLKRPTIKVLIIALSLIVVVYAAWPNQKAAAPGVSRSPGGAAAPDSFNRRQFSLTDPASIWVIVNKKNPLKPVGYQPTDLVFPQVPLRVPGNESMRLRAQSAGALEQMFAEAKIQGLNLQLSSGYRSYNYQSNLYAGYVRSAGQAQADKQSARPGHSEHQTGLAVDLEPTSRACELMTCFADRPEGKWLAVNAYKYGFIMRYPADKVSVTGYEYEPWHFRYVGVPLAGRLNAQGIKTLEEFFGVSGGPAY